MKKITRRKALAIGAVAIASPLAFARGSSKKCVIKNESPLDLYRLHFYEVVEIEYGQTHWIVARNEAGVIKELEKLGEYADGLEVLILRVPDDKVLEIRMCGVYGFSDIVKTTCRNWISIMDCGNHSGILASTFSVTTTRFGLIGEPTRDDRALAYEKTGILWAMPVKAYNHVPVRIVKVAPIQ